MKVEVSRIVPRGQVFLLSTETLEGDKIGCIYSVMIKMATTTNVQETTEDRRRQKYRKNNPKLVQLSNLNQKLLPKKIGQLPGATKIHELVFEIDGMEGS